MSNPNSKRASDTSTTSFAPGQLVWVRFSKKAPWPSRIAAEVEASEAVKAEKKSGQDFLVYYFGSHNYSWVKENQVSIWNPDSTGMEDVKLSNKAKSYVQGVEEGLEWAKGPKILPSGPLEKPKPEPKAAKRSEEKKRKSSEADADAPTAKRAKKAVLVEEESDSESDSDAPYKIPYHDASKARRVRVMRKLGLYPPEGSLFVISKEAQARV